MLGSLLYYSQQARHQRSRFLANLLWFDDYGHDQYNLTAALNLAVLQVVEQLALVADDSQNH